MYKKVAILGLVLLLTGGAVLAWILMDKQNEEDLAASCRLKYATEADEYLKQYSEWLQIPPEKRAVTPLELTGLSKAETRAELELEQHERLLADMGRLAAGEFEALPFADVLYGEYWQSEVEDYKKRQQHRESIITGSIALASVGGVTLGGCLAFSLVRLLLGLVSRRKKSSTDGSNRGDRTDNGKTARKGVAQMRKKKRHSKKPDEESFVGSARKTIPVHAAKHSTLPGSSGAAESKPADSKAKAPAAKAKTIPVLASAEKAPEPSPKSKSLTGAHRENVAQKVGQAILAGHSGSSLMDDPLKTTTETLERQMDEFRRMTQNAQKNTLDHAKPLNNALKELTQEVSAIREYASHQQERVQKLQDGYDWTIIRTFCLRVIRCIDNVESRIEGLAGEDVAAEHLEDVRDELIFALESSGIEQFRPEMNSPYRGQEKCTEAVKEKEQCEDPEQAGRIAKVVRPGYQYFVDEANTKVIRAAQVKLFG